MKGLIRETERMLNEESDLSVRDAILISCAQKIEHYEIASYGTLCTWAEVLGYEHALQALKQNIDEEERADAKLTELAGAINKEAVSSA
jgi:ferritin-like metal-binding protein YciE